MGFPVIHFEIGCRDLESTKSFYEKLFGWSTQPYGSSAMIDTHADSGISGHISALGHEPYNYVMFYVQVEDITVQLKKAESLGGKTLIPETEVPQMGHFAWFADPEGAIVGLWKPMATE